MPDTSPSREPAPEMWDSEEATLQDELHWLLDDLRAVEALRRTVPMGWRDRTLVDGLITRLTQEIARIRSASSNVADGQIAADAQLPLA